MKNKQELANYLDSYILRLNKILEKIDLDTLNSIVRVMVDTFENDNTVYVVGNGGSASTASHMQSDFSLTIRHVTDFRPKVVALTDNIPLLTSIGNDFSYDDIFVEQMRGKIRDKDTLIAISASGNSPNVVKAVEYANKVGGCTISFTGFDGGILHDIVDHSLHTKNPEGDYGPIEDVHLILNHLIVNYLVKDEVFLSIPAK